MRRGLSIAKAAVVAFYDDQATHHAGALTYYALMCLFPLLLLAVSVLGVLGEFPGTYDAIVRYLRGGVPATALGPLDGAVRAALKSKGTAAAALVVGALSSLYGATGYLEATRRVLNVIFDAHHGRSFLRRKLTDAASAFVLFALVLTTLTLMFAGGGLVGYLFGPALASAWAFGRWPAALVSALLVFSLVYFVTPDVKQRAFRWVTPGAVAGVVVWLLSSAAFSLFLAHYPSFNVTYGSFAAAIVLLIWLWLTNVALLFGACLNAEIERDKEVAEGVPEEETLNLPKAGRL